MRGLTYLLLFFTSISFAQADYVLFNEEVIFSFETAKEKQMVLAKDKENKYIVYRFGTKNKIELEYPENKDKDSWKKFTYSAYLRGGGISNLAMDLNYVAFVNGDYKYVIYTAYIAEEGEKSNSGIKVLDSKTDKLITDIKGKQSTRKGNLTVFKDNELINQDEEGMLYD